MVGTRLFGVEKRGQLDVTRERALIGGFGAFGFWLTACLLPRRRSRAVLSTLLIADCCHGFGRCRELLDVVGWVVLFDV